MDKYDVYGIGNALIDVEFAVDDSFLTKNKVEKGIMTLVDAERQSKLIGAIGSEPLKKQGGGSAANSMIAVSQFGGSAYYSCKVANDDYGKFYLESLKDSGVVTNLNVTSLDQGITGRCLVMITPDADRTMNTFLGITSELDITAINEDALVNSGFLYIEGYLITNEQSKAAMKAAKELAEMHGIKTSITLSDPSIVSYFQHDFEEVIGTGVDLLFCNESEAMQFTGTGTLLEAREQLKHVARSFAITLGKNGATIYDGDTFIDIESYPVQAIDTNGAGDMFAGAFLYGITNGHSHAQAGKIASLASSRIVSKYGPRLEKHETQEILDHVFNRG